MRSSARFICLALALIIGGNIEAFARDMVFADSHGNRVFVSEKGPGRFATAPAPSKVLKANNVVWNVVFDDVNSNTNVGFDDPVQGALRRNTALDVLSYIGGVLNIPTVVAINVTFELSETDGGGYLANAGTLWWTEPARFDNGHCFEHLTTGTDPSPGTDDINCTVDFGFNWNSDPGLQPTGSQVDLYSVLLHEMTHGLGILSLSDQLGRGLMGTNPDVYTVWDRLMQQGASTFCWNASTTALQVPTSAFTSDNLFFSGSSATGAHGSRPPIYAPGTYSNGSSLAHFKTGSVDSVMEHAISYGVAEREYSQVDIGALRDIGYTAAAEPVVVAPSPDFTATPTSGYAPLTVQFTDLSSNLPTSWTWDFDNDFVDDSTLQNPSHTYATPGSYTVTLIAGNSAGANSASKVAFITVTQAPLVTDVTLNHTGWFEEGEEVVFTASPAGALGYQWYHNGVAIPGATGATYNIGTATPEDSGSYYCEITTATHGVVTTNPVVLTVYPLGALPTAGWVAMGMSALAVMMLATILIVRRRHQKVIEH